ncbi:hypothetical protein F7725_012732 [Dissostichus mawsoni]|uniref:Uncharacterized protein n=1 Tax=Dissostichus mawsoni TaxID=36200 RepID=A0A7J5YNI7_DISMA|nr:hypothetical protein F7725_012732 [Dissostichus mawsoni]
MNNVPKEEIVLYCMACLESAKGQWGPFQRYYDPKTVGTSEDRSSGSGLETFAIMSKQTVNLDTYSLSLLTAKEDILNPRSSTNCLGGLSSDFQTMEDYKVSHS